MNREKKQRKWLSLLKTAFKPIAAILVLVAIILWTTGAFEDHITPGTQPHAPGFALPDDAEIFEVEKKLITRTADVTGTVSSEETIHIAARINAYVSAVHAGAGSKVAKDELLVSLDDRELLQQLSGAEARLNRAETEYNRTRRLFESGAATHRDYIAAESAYKSALARKSEIDVMLDFTEIRAPLDGVVTERHIETGDLAAPGQVLMTVYNPKAMRLEVPVPVRLSDEIAVGDHLPVKIEYPEGRVEGKVTEIVSKIDPASRTRTVKVSLPSSAREILPGTFGRIWVDAAAEEAIFVPKTAVYHVGQLEMVQQVIEERVHRRLVKTGPMKQGHIEILSGLSHGDAILVRPILSTPTGRRPSPAATDTEG